MVKELVERDKCSKNKEMSMFKEKPAVGREQLPRIQDFREASSYGS